VLDSWRGHASERFRHSTAGRGAVGRPSWTGKQTLSQNVKRHRNKRLAGVWCRVTSSRPLLTSTWAPGNYILNLTPFAKQQTQQHHARSKVGARRSRAGTTSTRGHALHYIFMGPIIRIHRRADGVLAATITGHPHTHRTSFGAVSSSKCCLQPHTDERRAGHIGGEQITAGSPGNDLGRSRGRLRLTGLTTKFYDTGFSTGRRLHHWSSLNVCIGRMLLPERRRPTIDSSARSTGGRSNGASSPDKSGGFALRRDLRTGGHC